jgi:putative ABC transport system substrate-binding protein
MTPMSRTRRLAVLGLLLLAVAVFPLAEARGQQPAKRYRIGVLNTSLASNAPMVEGLKTGLKQQGLLEGRDVSYVIRFTRGKEQAVAPAAEELVREKVDLIFANGAAAAQAAKAATATIPIVFTLVSDPVAAGLVKDLALPGANVTGVSAMTTELVPKRLEILKSVAPGVRRVLVVAHPDDPGSVAAQKKAQEVAAQFGVEVLARSVRNAADVQQALRELKPGDGMLPPDLPRLEIPGQMLEASLAQKFPAVFPTTLWIQQGALASYGSDPYWEGVQAASLVARILKGARPRDLAVEGATKLTLAINQETAKSLGITVPEALLKRADRVVE